MSSERLFSGLLSHTTVIDKIRNGSAGVAVMGINSESLSLAMGLSEYFQVTLYDGCEEYIELLQCGIDPFGQWEVASFHRNLQFTSQKGSFPTVDVYILAMQTMAADGLTQDITSLKNACRLIASHMQMGSVIIFEKSIQLQSMECFCLPMLEKLSGLEFGRDFNIGFVSSPEACVAEGDINSEKLWESHKSIEPVIQSLYTHLPEAR